MLYPYKTVYYILCVLIQLKKLLFFLLKYKYNNKKGI